MLAVVSAGALLGITPASNAQLMSKWGHPVFTFGSTPYDSTNAGHGNYPGGPGFIPGYGYYPGQGPDHYPWMDGPGTPFDRRQLWGGFPGAPWAAGAVLPPADGDTLPAGAALVIVRLPAEAELWFDDAKTSQTGSYRQFMTPALPAGRELVYTVRARWRVRDVELSRAEEVRVQPGGQSVVDFLTADSWAGHRLPETAARGK
jgi:uncharacterized protein (TIGR03000 family)